MIADTNQALMVAVAMLICFTFSVVVAVLSFRSIGRELDFPANRPGSNPPPPDDRPRPVTPPPPPPKKIYCDCHKCPVCGGNWANRFPDL